MATQFFQMTKNGRKTKRQVANRFFGGTARGCVVEWNANPAEDTMLAGTDGSRLTVAQLRGWQGAGKAK